MLRYMTIVINVITQSLCRLFGMVFFSTELNPQHKCVPQSRHLSVQSVANYFAGVRESSCIIAMHLNSSNGLEVVDVGKSLWDLWTDPWGTDFPAPARLFEQNFGLGLDDQDLFPPTLYRGWYVRPRRQGTLPQETGLSQVQNDDKEFKVNLDVTHFKPNEISVKAVSNRIVVEGKHEERQDDHGMIQRYFKRTYMLPKDVDSASVKSSLSADGVLTIAAPKNAIAAPEERQIAIQMSGSGDAKQ